MKRKSSITFGPGASSLILIFVVLAMCVLGMLSLMNSRNDIRLSERSVQVSEAVYALQTRAEEKRALIDEILVKSGKNSLDDEEARSAVMEALPDAEIDGQVVSWGETDGFRTIHCGLQIQPEGKERTRWIKFDLNAETEEAW